MLPPGTMPAGLLRPDRLLTDSLPVPTLRLPLLLELDEALKRCFARCAFLAPLPIAPEALMLAARVFLISLLSGLTPRGLPPSMLLLLCTWKSSELDLEQMEPGMYGASSPLKLSDRTLKSVSEASPLWWWPSGGGRATSPAKPAAAAKLPSRLCPWRWFGPDCWPLALEAEEATELDDADRRDEVGDCECGLLLLLFALGGVLAPLAPPWWSCLLLLLLLPVTWLVARGP
mmetsp:Transcript_22538/g.64079  ORF Transcript_22538/g.64079 Transcript_22538/m.64079 type:complete len:231 (+) Transcript_22538:1300-1992(+)